MCLSLGHTVTAAIPELPVLCLAIMRNASKACACVAILCVCAKETGNMVHMPWRISAGQHQLHCNSLADLHQGLVQILSDPYAHV